MGKNKKTVSVELVLTKVNKALKSKDLDQSAKSALCTLLESILLETNNYKGFYYIHSQVTLDNNFDRVYINPINPLNIYGEN